MSKAPRRVKKSHGESTVATIDDDGTQVERDERKTTTKKKSRNERNKTSNNDGPTAKAAYKDFVVNTCKVDEDEGHRERDFRRESKGSSSFEFDEIKKATQPITGIPKINFDSNATKNRYKDVYCVDESRVVLKWGTGGDYIHANWVATDDGRKYICTQGPTAATIDDFWRMVWQEKCKSIVMLCNVMEQGKKKCELYWPENEGEETKPGNNLTVKATSKIEFEKVMTLTHLQMTDGKVDHIIWNNWPDRGVPVDTLTVFKMLTKIKRLSPTVIHCSAGIGRTGTVVGMDILHTKLMKSESATLKQVVTELRKSRHGSVQMDIQYLYLARVTLAFAVNKKLVNDSDIADFVAQYETLCKARGFM